jgi:hypothetical protein
MIKLIFTVTEEEDGAIRFKGHGDNVGTPTHKEVEFTRDLLETVNKVTGPGDFVKIEDKIPMTIITWRDKDEHKNRD